MTRLPLISGNAMCSLLEGIGFVKVRQRGSHVFMGHEDGRRTVVPVHIGEQLGRGLIRAILRDVEITAEDYFRMRR